MEKCDLTKVNPVLMREFGNWIGTVERYGVMEVGEVKEKIDKVGGK